LAEARKQIDKSKDKLQLVVAREGFQSKSYSSPLSLQQHDQPGKLSDVMHDVSYVVIFTPHTLRYIAEEYMTLVRV